MEQRRQHFHVVQSAGLANGEAASARDETGEGGAPEQSTAGLRAFDRKRLINRLNYLAFQSRTVLLNFNHATYGDRLRVAARPQSCEANLLRCTWVELRAARALSKYYAFSSICVPDEDKLLKGTGNVVSLDKDGILIEIAPTCTEIDLRRVVRYPGRNVEVQMLSNGSRFDGTLLDFSPLSFRARISASPPQTFAWLNPAALVTVVLSRGREVLYSGDCRIVSNTGGRTTRDYVLEPTQDHVQRFERQQNRSVREKFVPTPTIVFEHPLTGRLAQLKVLDLSASGLAVEEYARNAVLMPGLMIPRLDLCLAGNARFSCRAQVVHRQVLDPKSEEPRLKYGLALLDMDVADHVQLVALLHHADDCRSYVCSQVDLDDLWSFFFDTGFIYPQKYGFIQKNREEIKQTYEKLYTHSPSIARHFIYHDRGKILGHMAMLRFYDSTWLIHHHAARTNQTYRAGLNVLGQITRFVNESCRFAFMHMDYVICFYRPENRFPRSVFGGLCRGIDDPRICSEALFAYYHLQCQDEAGGGPEDFALTPADEDDLRELSSFCQHESGGLMIRALDLEPGDIDHNDLTEEFRRLGLRRERHLYALKQNDHLQAVAMVNLADIGLNLSDLTNSITLFVLDQHAITRETLDGALSVMMKRFAQQEISVLIYPESAAKTLKIPVEKRYVMWSLIPRHSDSFYRSMNAILQAGKRNGGNHEKRRPPPV
jgi:hypothetical protein